MAKKDLSNLLGGHVDGMTILLMSLDILQKEVGEAVKAKKEKYDAKLDEVKNLLSQVKGNDKHKF